MTLVCPTFVPAGENRGCISLDWSASKMRYQIDRKFVVLAALASLELTEIGVQDAEKYLPDFPHQSGGQKS